MTFEDFDLDERLLAAIAAQHFHKPTEVQQQAIPAMLERQDLLVGAATGTGKTAAFVLPALQYLLDEPQPSQRTRVMILAPTRELAFQIHKVVKQLGTHCHFKSTVVTGGFAQDKQLSKLKDEPIDILVATPGRLLNIMTQEFIDLSEVELLIIDEADRMLDMGQGPDVAALLEAIPGDFQASCFSATLAGGGVERFAETILDEPQVIQIHAANQQSQNVQQSVYFADDKAHKQTLLLNLLQDPSCTRALIFCNKKERAIELNEWLIHQEVQSTVLHGDFVQAKRMDKLNRFKSGKVQVMVATDVAARGIDIEQISHVINWDTPIRGDIYIHRIGRTGRAQTVGLAINLVEAHDLSHLRRIEYHLKQKIPLATLEGFEPKTRFYLDQSNKKKPHKKKLAKKKAKRKASQVKKKTGARPSRPKSAKMNE